MVAAHRSSPGQGHRRGFGSPFWRSPEPHESWRPQGRRKVGKKKPKVVMMMIQDEYEYDGDDDE